MKSWDQVSVVVSNFCFSVIFFFPPLAGESPSRSGEAQPVAGSCPVAQRAASGQRRLGLAGQTALQSVHGPVQQLHPDAQGPGEHAGGHAAAKRGRCRRRRSCFLPASLSVWDLHTHISRWALSKRDPFRGRRVQGSGSGLEFSVTRRHTQSQIQVWDQWEVIMTEFDIKTGLIKRESAVFFCFHSFTGSLPHHFQMGGEKRDSSMAGAAPNSAAPGRRRDWWESAGNKLYTIATDKTISKLMMEYKRRKQPQQQPQQVQQSHINLFMKEQGRAAAGGERRGPAELQRPQQLVDQQGPSLRHSVSAGPEVLRQEKRPRSGSTISSHSISLRDSEAQIQVGLFQTHETQRRRSLLLHDLNWLQFRELLWHYETITSVFVINQKAAGEDVMFIQNTVKLKYRQKLSIYTL